MRDKCFSDRTENIIVIKGKRNHNHKKLASLIFFYSKDLKMIRQPHIEKILAKHIFEKVLISIIYKNGLNHTIKNKAIKMFTRPIHTSQRKLFKW